MRIAFTGYTGFIGTVLGNRLEARAEQDLALVRQHKIKNFKEKEGSPLSFTVFAQDDDDLRDELRRRDVFIHLAGRAHKGGAEAKTFEQYVADNIDLALKMARLSVEAGMKRFIFISSIGVHGQSTTGRAPFSVNDIPNPQTAYAQSKLRAEEKLKEFFADKGTELVIIRPPLVYGVNAPGNIAKLKKLIASGLPVPLGGLHNKRSIVTVDDVVECIMEAALNKKTAPALILPVSETLSTTALYSRLAHDMGVKKPRVIKAPTALMQRVGRLTRQTGLMDQLLGDLEIIPTWTPNRDKS